MGPSPVFASLTASLAYRDLDPCLSRAVIPGTYYRSGLLYSHTIPELTPLSPVRATDCCSPGVPLVHIWNSGSVTSTSSRGRDVSSTALNLDTGISHSHSYSPCRSKTNNRVYALHCKYNLVSYYIVPPRMFGDPESNRVTELLHHRLSHHHDPPPVLVTLVSRKSRDHVVSVLRRHDYFVKVTVWGKHFSLLEIVTSVGRI